jgi:glycosyltransferase involved in cell wall biosynthesis
MNARTTPTNGRRSLRIAMLGTRGVPARYGGLETVAEEVGARLAERGHRVTVYCRSRNSPTDEPVYRGMRRVLLPSLPEKHLDTPSHTALSAAQAVLRRPVDVVHLFGVGNAAWLAPLRLAGRASVISVDGMDWRRRKWGRFARMALERSSGLAIRLSGACITDSREVARHYVERYGREPHYIAHGVDVAPATGRGALETYGLEERGYVLFVGRVTPEKGLHNLVRAFADVPTDRKLVVVGEGSQDERYWRELQSLAAADPRVRLLGAVYGQASRELLAHAHCYVQPSEVEGTALSLVEAMGYGNCVVVSGIRENLEAVGDAGLSFDPVQPVESLAERLRELMAAPALVEAYRACAKAFAGEHYSWERVTDAHEAIYLRLLGLEPHGSGRIAASEVEATAPAAR